MFKASDYHASGLRERHHTPPFGKPYTDFVCRRCVVIVPKPNEGCQLCKEQVAKTEAERERSRAFFAEQRAKRKAERAEADRLTQEAVAARRERRKHDAA